MTNAIAQANCPSNLTSKLVLSFAEAFTLNLSWLLQPLLPASAILREPQNKLVGKLANWETKRPQHPSEVRSLKKKKRQNFQVSNDFCFKRFQCPNSSLRTEKRSFCHGLECTDHLLPFSKGKQKRKQNQGSQCHYPLMSAFSFISWSAWFLSLLVLKISGKFLKLDVTRWSGSKESQHLARLINNKEKQWDMNF